MFSWYVDPILYEVLLPALLVFPAIMMLISLWDIVSHYWTDHHHR